MQVRISVPQSGDVAHMLSYLFQCGIQQVKVTQVEGNLFLEMEVNDKDRPEITEAQFVSRFGKLGYREYLLFMDLTGTRHLTRVYIPDEAAWGIQPAYQDEFAERIACSLDQTYQGDAALQVAYLFPYESLNPVPVRVDKHGNVL